MGSTKKPKIVFLALADSHRIGADKKVDCFGIFSKFYVWGFPANRKVSCILGISNFKDEATISLFWKPPKEGRIRIGSINVKKQKERFETVVPLAGSFTISMTKTQIHYLEAEIEGEVFRTPLIVTRKKWPHFTQKKVNELLKDPSVIKSAASEVSCSTCGHRYLFEVHLDKSKPISGGAQNFPEDGLLICKTCETKLYLKDIEGQMRSLLGKKPKQRR